MKIIKITSIYACVLLLILSCSEAHLASIKKNSQYSIIEGKDIEARNKLRHKGRKEGRASRNELRHKGRPEDQLRNKVSINDKSE